MLAIDSSKARQLSLITSLGYAVPETRVVHRARDLLAAAEGWTSRCWSRPTSADRAPGSSATPRAEELRASIADGTVPQSVDQVLLVQDYVPPRGGTIIRIETLGGHFLYAIEVESGGDSFDLCPADACVAQPGRAAIRMTAVSRRPKSSRPPSGSPMPRASIVGGVEVVIDDRDGTPRFYDINAMSNFVADPLNVLGWDPHDRLIDYPRRRMVERQEAA